MKPEFVFEQKQERLGINLLISEIFCEKMVPLQARALPECISYLCLSLPPNVSQVPIPLSTAYVTME